MLYKDFNEKKLSALGLGCMRLPTVGGDSSVIDEEATDEMLRYALENGVNYIDTAWGYHGGNSERVMGKLLEKYPRDSFYLASKFPGYAAETWGRVEEIFEEQLKKCRVDYFDFYMFHNVCEKNIDAYLDDEKYGIFTYLMKQKENGRIRHLGFSAHGNMDTLKRFLDAYGEHMEFCQLQVNWLDWHLQKACDKVALMRSHGIPVWVMEPIRGGKLATLSEKYMSRLKALRPDETAPSWAFRFLQTLPEVTMILSGMSNFTQVKENISTFGEHKPLDEKEWNTILQIADEMTAPGRLPCTSCRYCVDRCPMELNIPWLIELYNEQKYSPGFLAPMAMSNLPEEKKPSACIGCRSCEEVCPQNIKVSEMMSDFVKIL